MGVGVKVNSLKYIFAIVLITTLFSTANAGDAQTNKTEKLLLTISLNEKLYHVGHSFEVTCGMKNISDKPLRILPWMLPYTTQNFNVYDSKRHV